MTSPAVLGCNVAIWMTRTRSGEWIDWCRTNGIAVHFSWGGNEGDSYLSDASRWLQWDPL